MVKQSDTENINVPKLPSPVPIQFQPSSVESGEEDDDHLEDPEKSAEIEDDDEIQDFQGEPNKFKSDQISKSDAASLVGGEDIGEESTKKIFAFQLPFGGSFPGIKSHFFHPKLPNLSNLSNLPSLTHIFSNNDNEEIKEDIRLKLSRQESMNTLHEAEYFRTQKVRDDVRFRAVKHSLASKYTELLPHMNNTKLLEDYELIYSKLEGNVVILGGYRGSILRDAKTHKRVWIPLKAGFNLRKINLLLGPSPEDEINAVKYMYPDGILKNIGPIDLCKSLIRKLSSNPKARVHEFGYDWRLSGEFVAKQLEQYLQDIFDKTGEPTLVICHSMGGLITHRALHRNPQLFRSIVYVGVPSECLNILGPIRTGESVLFLDKILTAEANFMMRSSFNFLPLSGKVFYNSKTNEPYILDLFNPDTWVEYNLNPLVASTRLERKSSELTLLDSSLTSISSMLKSIKVKSLSPRARSPKTDSFDNSLKPVVLPSESDGGYKVSFEQAYQYLSETLKLAKAFIEDLDYKPELEDQYPPMAIVYGNTVPSVRGSHVKDEQDIKDGNYYDFFYGHGDGVVHQKWLMPERKGFEVYDPDTGKGQVVGRFSSTLGHVSLMTDHKAMGKALNAVYEAEKIWKRDLSSATLET